ncbi:hypothetical protein R1sor_027053 [Riccia sorocarpa]|uniref:RING-type domain-containing protein n=1 Tax=Riccia sorocarpa TaxID=122646 RepID=A0ABD3GGA0_9MARC
MLEFDPAAIGRLAVDDIMDSGMQTSPMPPVRNTEPASGSQPAPPMRGSKKKKKEVSNPKRKKVIPEVQAPVPQTVDAPSAGETSLIPPNGVPGEICLGIRVNVEEFKKDFTSGDRVWSSGKLNIRDNSPLIYPKLPTPSLNERKMAARRELFRMRVRMDGRLVETMDPDEMEKSQKGNRPRKRKRRRGKRKYQKPRLDRRIYGWLKTTLNLSRADQYKEPSIGSPTGQTSGRGSNQPMTSEIPVDDPICSIGVLEESASNLATHTMSHISLVLEEHKRLRRLQAELEERLAALAEIEKENLALSNKVHTLEAEKQCMSDRVKLMSRPDLYELLEAKLDDFQLANHAGVVGNFENLTLTTTRKWTAILGLNLDRFQQCPDEFPDFASYAEKWNGWKEHCSLCTSSLGFLPSINTGVCQHNFHFTCFWKYASTKRLCPICLTALPDATYEFFCTIFVPQGNESINPNTGETVTMEKDVEREELVGGRGRHVTRNEVDVVNTGEHKRFAFIEMNKALNVGCRERST